MDRRLDADQSAGQRHGRSLAVFQLHTPVAPPVAVLLMVLIAGGSLAFVSWAIAGTMTRLPAAAAWGIPAGVFGVAVVAAAWVLLRDAGRVRAARRTLEEAVTSGRDSDPVARCRALAVMRRCSDFGMTRLGRSDIDRVELASGEPLPVVWVVGDAAARELARALATGTAADTSDEGGSEQEVALKAHTTRTPRRTWIGIGLGALIIIVGTVLLLTLMPRQVAQGWGRIALKGVGFVLAVIIASVWAHVFRYSGWWFRCRSATAELTRHDRRGSLLQEVRLDPADTFVIVYSGKRRRTPTGDRIGTLIWRVLPRDHPEGFEVGDVPAHLNPWSNIVAGVLPQSTSKGRSVDAATA